MQRAGLWPRSILLRHDDDKNDVQPWLLVKDLRYWMFRPNEYLRCHIRRLPNRMRAWGVFGPSCGAERRPS
eukprot:scaffold15108_cov180-Amphora_coffeaeformis.AAC.4